MSVKAIEAEVYIQSGVEAEVEIGREIVKTVYEESVLEPLSVTENGTYEPEEGVDGYSDVTVAVPERIPVTESLSVMENGTYEPSDGIDGYDRVVVDVPLITPEIEPLTVTQNGTYTADGDGFNPVTVNVEVPKDPNVCEGEFTVPETGVYTLNLDYHGDSFPKLISIYQANGPMKLSEDFDAEPLYTIDTYISLKTSHKNPTYDSDITENQVRYSASAKLNYGAFTSLYNVGYLYKNEDPERGHATMLRITDNKTIKIWASDVYVSGKHAFGVGIRYKYQVFY